MIKVISFSELTKTINNAAAVKFNEWCEKNSDNIVIININMTSVLGDSTSGNFVRDSILVTYRLIDC